MRQDQKHENIGEFRPCSKPQADEAGHHGVNGLEVVHKQVLLVGIKFNLEEKRALDAPVRVRNSEHQLPQINRPVHHVMKNDLYPHQFANHDIH